LTESDDTKVKQVNMNLMVHRREHTSGVPHVCADLH